MGFKKEQKQRNKHVVKCMKDFGFTNIKEDNNGWVIYPELLEVKEIELFAKNEILSQNSIEVGRGLNNFWTYGVTYCTGGCGGSGSASIFGEKCKSKEEAIIKAFSKLIEYHLYQKKRCEGDGLGNYNEAYSIKIRNEALKKIKNLTNETNEQNGVDSRV